MAPRIAIITQAYDDFTTRRSFLLEMARIWQDDGVEVDVYTRPVRGAIADLAIMHVNLTVVPQQFLDFGQTFPKTLNGGVADISKRFFSTNLIQRNSTYHGPVVVKSNENHGGAPETRIQQKIMSAPGVHAGGIHFTQAKTTAPEHPRLAKPDYYIVDSPDQVSEAVWSNPNIVVEKLLSEREGEYYILRNWHFFGDREFHTKCFAHGPIVKTSNLHKREPITEPIPEKLRELRRQYHFDFGKWDYAIVDGDVVLYDTNKTPNIGSLTDQQAQPKVEILAAGIHSFL